MSSFSRLDLVGKLRGLSSTQKSIETLSHWVMLHSRRAKDFATVWTEEFPAVSASQQLCLLYLANDVLQNSRKKTQLFKIHFQALLATALPHLKVLEDPSLVDKAKRLFIVWEERDVFGKDFSDKLLSILSRIAPTAQTPPISRVRRSVQGEDGEVVETKDDDVTKVTKLWQTAEEMAAKRRHRDISKSGLEKELSVREELLSVLQEMIKIQEQEMVAVGNTLEDADGDIAAQQVGEEVKQQLQMQFLRK